MFDIIPLKLYYFIFFIYCKFVFVIPLKFITESADTRDMAPFIVDNISV